jgi:hypothetical protein
MSASYLSKLKYVNFKEIGETLTVWEYCNKPKV